MATTYLSIFFNSRSPHGERQSKHEILIIRIYFQFTLPAWRATGEPIVDVSAFIFSILAPRMESDKEISCDFSGSFIFSIHAPRMESDLSSTRITTKFEFSIHAPRMESDFIPMHWLFLQFTFQFTLPAWRATCTSPCSQGVPTFFNSRSPHGERRW